MKIVLLSNIMIPEIAEELGRSGSVRGGWISGVVNTLAVEENVDLTVLYPGEKSITGKTNTFSFICFERKDIISQFHKIIEEIKPDVIHVFGTEFIHTRNMVEAANRCGFEKKVIINIQGLVSVYSLHYTAGLPYKIINMYTFRDVLRLNNIKAQQKAFHKRGCNEVYALKNVSNVIGRTDWDEACTKRINRSVNYYFCNETLRAGFYHQGWTYDNCEKFSIFLSQGNYPIKGLHHAIEALNEIIKSYPKAKVYVTGESPLTSNIIKKMKQGSYQCYIARLLRKYKLENNVVFLGMLDEAAMREQYLKSHVFLCPSSIENSPNSLGEAMLLGVPCITADVGGVKNMITHEREGYIYQSDAPYMIPYYVDKVFAKKQNISEMCDLAHKKASITHNKERNLQQLLKIYNTIINRGD